MKYKILKEFHSPQLGNCRPGDKLELSEPLAEHLKEHGMIGDIVETKPVEAVKLETKPSFTKKASKKAK